MKSKMATIAVPVLPLPELQWTTTTRSLSAARTSLKQALTFDVVVALLGNLKDETEGWPVVVWPVVLSGPVSEILGLVVRGPFAYIDKPVFIAMLFV